MSLTVVTGVIKNERNEILLQKRNKLSAFGGLWETPGGKVKFSETNVEALRRELREELGLESIEIDLYAFLVARFYRPVLPRETVVYLYWVKTNETPTALEGQEELTWADLRQMPVEVLVPSAKVLRAYLRTMNPYDNR